MTDSERAATRAAYSVDGKPLVAFFGFANRRKGVEVLFEIADPDEVRLVLICDLDPWDSYHRTLLKRITSDPWRGRVSVTGFLAPSDAARLLAASDAVVLPFPNGGGVWSTSAQAAIIQGTFTLVTSLDRNGYDPTENVYYAHPSAIGEMRDALKSHVGRRKHVEAGHQRLLWDAIARQHVDMYRSLLAKTDEPKPTQAVRIQP